METIESPFAVLEEVTSTTARGPMVAPVGSLAFPAVGRFGGFDLQDRPLVSGVGACPGETLTARSTLPMTRDLVGREVVLIFEEGKARCPIIVGVLQSARSSETPAPAESGVRVTIDGERHVIEAEREIVLRCGEASITLTRAGKVLIQGTYVSSRSSGYNKIKGAAVDIN